MQSARIIIRGGFMKERLLFIGDSITDSGRHAIDDEMALGNGYVRLIFDWFSRSGTDVDIINKGSRGFTTFDLKENWEKDCIKYNPDIVTILIGINEILSMIYGGSEMSEKDYEKNLEWLIQETLGNTDAQIILMDTFIFNQPAELIVWREYVDRQIQIIRNLAMKYETGYVNLDGIFARFVNRYGTKRFTQDGIHLTRNGHKVVMQEWVKEYEFLKNNSELHT